MGAIERVEIANMHQQTAARAERLLQAVPDARTAVIAVAAGSGNRKLFESFGVDVKVRRATAHMQRCKVDQTPSIVINGRYLVKGATREDMLRIASYLIEKEHHS